MCSKCEKEVEVAESERRKVRPVFCENWDKWVCPVCGEEAPPDLGSVGSDVD